LFIVLARHHTPLSWAGTLQLASCFPAPAGVPVKRKLLNYPVDVPSLVDIKLDGTLVKLEQLLQLQPWRKPVGSATDGSSTDGSAAAAAGFAGTSSQAAVAAGSGTASAAAGGDAGKKVKRPKAYKVVEFTVKAAAVLAGHEAPVLPAQLLQWALQVSGGLLLLVCFKSCGWHLLCDTCSDALHACATPAGR
jgi:hypothetical protein